MLIPYNHNNTWKSDQQYSLSQQLLLFYMVFCENVKYKIDLKR